MCRIGRCLANPFYFLLLASEPGNGHQTQAIDQKDRRKTRIDGGNFLGNQLQIDVTDASAAIFLRQKAHRESQFVGFFIRPPHHLERFLCVLLKICFLHDRFQAILRELTSFLLQSFLRLGQREVDSHDGYPP